jgi:hypothetical protein
MLKKTPGAGLCLCRGSSLSKKVDSVRTAQQRGAEWISGFGIAGLTPRGHQQKCEEDLVSLATKTTFKRSRTSIDDDCMTNMMPP